MDYTRIGTVTEKDFDGVIEDAGGVRIDAQGSADYLLNEAVVELKLVQEEGFDVQTRQDKIAKLFRRQQPNGAVVIIDPDTLDSASSREYYSIVERPIREAVHKAAKQLEVTLPRYNRASVRALVILNNGYSALSGDEFKAVCIKCARNDKRKVDWLIVGGMYYYSDTFDGFLIAPFEPESIGSNASFPSCEALEKSWGKYVEQKMTALIRAEAPLTAGKLPVFDLIFELDGIRYVKPAPYLGRSEFFPPGHRPRRDSTGIRKCPAVATNMPRLSEENWLKFRRAMPRETCLQSTYREWVNFLRQEEEVSTNKLKPTIAIDVRFEDFANQISKPTPTWEFVDLCDYSSVVFDSRCRDVLFRANKKEQLAIVIPEYIYLIVQEIGQDRANDMCSVYHVSEVPGHEFQRPIFENEKLFLEYGLPVASAYAIKLGIDSVLYAIDRKYAWS